jgi:DNA-binding CsgD family transcriptional regulator/putative methionine-R-sulfoxide reductase with GAF domain
MSSRETKPLNSETIGRKLRAVRLIQDLYLKADSYQLLPEIFQMILRSLDDLLEFKHSMIYLLNEDGDTLVFQSGWGYPDNHAAVQVKIGKGFIGMAARSGEVLRIGDLHKSLQYMKAIRAGFVSSSLQNKLEEPAQMPGLSNPQSLMSVPLMTKSGVIGVIVVESKLACAFNEIDQELLLLVAGQTARLIEEVRRTELNRRRLEGLLHAKVHLDRLNMFLDTVTSAATMGDSPTYTAAMAKQIKGFSYAQMKSELACTYFEEAAGIFQEIGMALQMVRSKLGAVVLTLPGRRDDAARMLQECLIGFEECGASAYAELTRTLMTLLQPRDTGTQQLTKREREVAVLVAQGLSNTEISERLYVSIRTVTTHLERIYAKLGLRSRSALSHYIVQYT